MKKNYAIAGFSLIELMIVIAIIGILSTIVLPSYQNYAQRARFTEVIIATAPFKTAISLAAQQGIPLKELNANSENLPPEPAASKNLASLKVKNGLITATSTALAGQASYILTPSEDGSHWTVSGSCLAKKLCEA